MESIDDEAAVYDVGLPERAVTLCARNDVITVADLCVWTRADLLGLDGSSEALVDGIEAALAKFGRRLSTPETQPGAAAAPPPVPKKTRKLRCRLTTKEHRAVAKELARTHEEIDDLDARIDALKDQVKDLTKERGVLEQRASEKARAYRARSTFRDVECVEVHGPELEPRNPDAPRDGIRTIRLDTNEPIEWREFTSSERQGSLFDESSDQAAAP